MMRQSCASGGGALLRVPTSVFSQHFEGRGSLEQTPGRVLIVEDEYFVALSIEETLSDAGFVVVGMAATAEQAIAMAAAERPDIVLMDIRLGGARDGIDAAAQILERFGIPSILATAQADPGTRRRGEQAARPIGWVFKPFAPGELAAAVGDAVVHVRQHGSKT